MEEQRLIDPNGDDSVQVQPAYQLEGEEESAQLKSTLPPTPHNKSQHTILSATINLLMVAVLVILAILLWQRFINKTAKAVSVSQASYEAVQPVENQSDIDSSIDINPLEITQQGEIDDGITRSINYHTIIPARPRQNVITYTVQRYDTLFGISDQFKLKPETILWGNFETLQDNPHLLKPDQVLNILPVDGTYYQWHSGDSVSSVASFFGVSTEDILGYPGNEIDLTSVTTQTTGIDSGKWLIIPGGMRAIKDWGPPAISRQNPAAARYYGDGSCGTVVEGAVGTGTFVWPTGVHSLSGYTFTGIHPAIDIAGAVGNPVNASDSGVVVFSGWSNYGYGYLIVLDHGNGYQTAYAHLSAVAVTCGQSVFQGGYIGAVGNTGNSAGSHLHFELSYGGAKLNPLEYLP